MSYTNVNGINIFADEMDLIVDQIRYTQTKSKSDAIPMFKIKVNYKSGTSHIIWASEFSVSGGTYSWKCIDPHNDILLLGVDDIESIYQVGVAFIEKKVYDELTNDE